MAEIHTSKKLTTFAVTRQAIDLISPALPTSYERKELSDIDTVDDLRFQGSVIQIYENNNTHLHGVTHPEKVIKEAVAKALVSYYPLAGRLRAAATGRKLILECNGEGILFIEANADVTLKDFGEPLCPPFCMKELLYDVPGSSGLIDCPLIVIQVTQLKCGGFIFAMRFNHTVIDGVGIAMFLSAIAELAHGAKSLSVDPVWERNLLTAHHLLQLSTDNNVNSNYKSDDIDMKEDIEEDITTKETIVPHDDLVYKSFFFGPSEIEALRSLIPASIGPTTTNFDLIAAHLWRSRTIALYNDPEEVVQFRFPINIRPKLNPPLPKGYYGNAIIAPVAETTARKLSENPLEYSLELVREVKHKGNDTYIKSLVGRVVSEGVHDIISMNGFSATDHTRLGFNRLDFGWGKPVYGGSSHGGITPKGNFISFLVPLIHYQENGVLVPVCLPSLAMDKFVKTVNIGTNKLVYFVLRGG